MGSCWWDRPRYRYIKDCRHPAKVIDFIEGGNNKRRAVLGLVGRVFGVNHKRPGRI